MYHRYPVANIASFIINPQSQQVYCNKSPDIGVSSNIFWKELPQGS